MLGEASPGRREGPRPRLRVNVGLELLGRWLQAIVQVRRVADEVGREVAMDAVLRQLLRDTGVREGTRHLVDQVVMSLPPLRLLVVFLVRLIETMELDGDEAGLRRDLLEELAEVVLGHILWLQHFEPLPLDQVRRMRTRTRPHKLPARRSARGLCC